MFALTLKGGTCMSTPPDVCQTPAPPGSPVPTPYVNIFQCSMVTPNTACSKVFIDGSPALNIKSATALSNGDEPGVNGGERVISVLIDTPAEADGVSLHSDGPACVELVRHTLA